MADRPRDNKGSHDQPQPALPREQQDEARRLSLEDVLEAGATSLTSRISETDRGGLNYDVLDHVVTRTETSLAGRSLEDPKFSSSDPAEGDDGAGIGSTELEQLVAILETESAAPVIGDESEAKLEHASILLHEIHRLGIQDPEAFGRRIESILRGIPGEQVTELLAVATEDMAAALEANEFDVWMTAMGPLLRRAVPFLVDRLAEYTVRAADPATRETLWPHVIDTFLLSLRTRTREIDPAALELDEEARARAIDRLCRLQALGAGMLNPGTYRIDQEFARPIALRLMESEARGLFGPHLLAAFRQSLPHDFGARSCALALKRYDDAIGWVLARQLEGLRQPLDEEAQRSAAWVLVHGIAALEPERREETWIPDAIRWLGAREMARDPDEQRRPCRELLERIKSERQGLLSHVWPKACRKEAVRALQNPHLAEQGDH